MGNLHGRRSTAVEAKEVDTEVSTEPSLSSLPVVEEDPYATEEISQSYEIGDIIGSGGFGAVHYCTRRQDGKELAVKIIDKSLLDPDGLAYARSEIHIMAKIDHPNCVKLYEAFESDRAVYMVMERLNGGLLIDYIIEKGTYTEKEAATVTKDVLSALIHVHALGIIHRDLKPENLLYVEKGRGLKLTDFGLAVLRTEEVTDKLISDPAGTAGYVSPEVLLNKPFSSKVDMWSLGVMLYIILCGFPPFFEETNEEIFERIKEGDYSFPKPYWSDVSEEAQDLIRKLLEVNPDTRLSAKEAMAHPWVAKNIAPSRKLSQHHRKSMLDFRARIHKRHRKHTMAEIERRKSLLPTSSSDDMLARRAQVRQKRASTMLPGNYRSSVSVDCIDSLADNDDLS